MFNFYTALEDVQAHIRHCVLFVNWTTPTYSGLVTNYVLRYRQGNTTSYRNISFPFSMPVSYQSILNNDSMEVQVYAILNINGTMYHSDISPPTTVYIIYQSNCSLITPSTLPQTFGETSTLTWYKIGISVMALIVLLLAVAIAVLIILLCCIYKRRKPEVTPSTYIEFRSELQDCDTPYRSSQSNKEPLYHELESRYLIMKNMEIIAIIMCLLSYSTLPHEYERSNNVVPPVYESIGNVVYDNLVQKDQ